MATNVIDEFPPEVAEEVIGLLYLGQLTSDVHWAGHNFTLRTLKTGEELAVALLLKDFTDNIGMAKAYATATVAAALESVDGRPLIGALGPDVRVSIGDKHQYLSENWYWPVIEFLYNEYLKLLERQIAAFQAFEGKS